MRKLAVLESLIVLLMCISSAKAQTTITSVLVGSITDQTGAAIAGATITATDVSRDYSTKGQSHTDGSYRLEGLLPGTYRVIFSMSGFQTVVDDQIILYARQDRRIDVRLQVGAVSQQVTVKAQGSVLNTENATHATSQSSLETTQYPWGMRGYINGDTDGSPLYTQLSVVGVSRSNNTTNGSTGSQFRASWDGNNADNRGTFRPDEDALGEVQVFTVNAPAEFMSSSEAIGVSRSGTNLYHGSARIDIGNTDLNALGPCGTCEQGPGVPTVQEDFNFGGPIRRNRTFFNLSYSHFISRYNNFTTGFVFPQQGMRSGDLSIFPEPVMNPYTGQPFPGNIIPSNMISPVSQKMMDYFPLPNQGGKGNLTDNYGLPLDSINKSTNWDLRLDHQFTPNHRIYFSWSRVWDDQVFPNLGNASDPDPRVSEATGVSTANLYTFGYTWVASPSIVNEFMFGINKTPDTNVTGKLQGNQVLQDFGLPYASSVPGGIGFPEVSITGFNGFGDRSGVGNFDEYQQYTIRDSVSISRGKHLLKAGVQVVNNRPSMISNDPGTWGSFNFDGSVTGNAFADFLLGLPNTTSLNLPRVKEIDHWSDLGFFLQDSWRVKRNLTVDLGLRNQIFTVPLDANNLYYNFDPATLQVVVPNQQTHSKVVPGYPIPVVTASDVRWPEKLIKGKKLMLEPRVGIAWRMTPKTVLRTGYGIYHVPPVDINSILGPRATGPFSRNESFGPNQFVNGSPLMSFANPFPTAPGALGPQTVTGLPVDFSRPYTQQWNLTFEREIPWHMGLSVAYVGTSGTNLAYIENLNQPAPSLQPYQPLDLAFQKINYINYGGNSFYNSFRVVLNRQFSSGLYLRASYERDQFRGDVSSAQSSLYGGATVENPYDRRAYWGTYDGFEPDYLKIVAVYPLPFGNGQRFLSSSRVADAVLGGWTISTYLLASAGMLLSPTFSGSDPSNTGVFGGRPDLVAGCNPGGQVDSAHWFDKNCFEVPAPGHFGNAPIGALRGPAWWMQDLGVYKDFGLGEWKGFHPKLRIEAESWDPWNHPTRRRVATNISASSFGYAPAGSTDGMTTGWRYIVLNAAITF